MKAPAASIDVLTGTLIFGGTALLFIALAWDGVVRRQIRVPISPLGGGSFAIKGVWAVLLGIVGILAGGFCLLLALGAYATALKQCHGSWPCMGTLFHSIQPAAGWGWFGLCLAWFVIVWLRTGDPRKRMLVYGVWYHQERVAQRVLRVLRARHLPPVPTQRLYALETDLVQLMHQRGWLMHGKSWLDSGQRSAQNIPVSEMEAEVLRISRYQHSSISERAAIQMLLEYFVTTAQQAKHMSRLRRWWTGSAQIGKRMLYGRRAM